MALSRTNFIIERHDSFGGNFVDSVYLGASYNMDKPHVLQDFIMRMYSAKSRFTREKLLMGLTGGRSDMGRKTEISTDVYRYSLQGADYKCARVKENLEAGNAAPGLNGATFDIKLDLDYFDMPDVLMGEDPDFMLDVVKKGPTDALGTIYTVRLQTDNPNAFFPQEYLEVGREFSKVSTSTVGERNGVYGTQQYAAPIKVERQLGHFAQKLEVTDKAWRMDGMLAIDFLYNDKGTDKVVKNFLPYAEHMMNEELLMGMEAAAWYGQKSTKEGYNGYIKRTGAGVRQQLADGHTKYFSGPLTTSEFKDYFLDIFFAREDQADRKVIDMTGTLGSLAFHDMLATEAASFLTLDTHFTKMISQNPRHLSFGAQYKHYQGPEGIEVTLALNPMYDSKRYDKRRHPVYTEIPLDSARHTFLDFGSGRDGQSNVCMVTQKDTYRYGYVAGTHTPSGPVKGGQAGSLIAGYTHFTEGSMGICIKDPTRGGEYIFDIE